MHSQILPFKGLALESVTVMTTGPLFFSRSLSLTTLDSILG